MDNFKEMFNNELYAEIENLSQEKADKTKKLNKFIKTYEFMNINDIVKFNKLSMEVVQVQLIINHLYSIIGRMQTYNRKEINYYD